MGRDDSSLLWLEDLNVAPLCGTHLGPSWVQGGSGLYQDNSCQRKEGCQRPIRIALWRRSGVRFPLVPVLCFSPSPFSSSFSLLLSSFLSFSSPRFPLVPVLCFWFGFCVCVFGGGGLLWCGVLCGCGLRLAWVWFVVFDVGVVWMGGSVLGPVWVRVCLAVCAFVRVSLLCCFGGEF